MPSLSSLLHLFDIEMTVKISLGNGPFFSHLLESKQQAACRPRCFNYSPSSDAYLLRLIQLSDQPHMVVCPIRYQIHTAGQRQLINQAAICKAYLEIIYAPLKREGCGCSMAWWVLQMRRRCARKRCHAASWNTRSPSTGKEQTWPK